MSNDLNEPAPVHAEEHQPFESKPHSTEARSDSLADREPLDLSSDPALLVGQVVADRYRVIEMIGRGGMGTVYRADHVHIRKSFALKVLHRELTHHAEAVRRFEREAIAAARIDHPNVATAVDFGRLPSGAFYLVLDYVQGRSLRQLLADETHLSELRTVRIARQIASALAAAHAKGVVHRDLKPDNVMLVDASSEPDFVKVLDFGIAKLRTEEVSDEPAITRFGTVFGTPEYMSPEQALGQSVDVHSDLYTLGIMVYEMLVGNTPFADEQLVTVLTRQMTEPPPPLPNQTSAELRQIVANLLEKRPEQRPASAELVLAEFDNLLLRFSVEGSTSSGQIPLRSRSIPDGAIAVSDTLLASDGTQSALRMATRDAANPANEPWFARGGAERNPSLPPWIRRQIRIAGRRVPLVLFLLLAALAAGLTIGGVGIWAIFSRTTGTSKDGPPAPILSALIPESAEDKQLRLWIEQSLRGDPVALQHLEKLPESSRNGTTWLAIAAGRSESKEYVASIQAYRRAAQADLTLVLRTPRVPNDVYRAALDVQASSAALEFASDYLGGAGMDLIYAVSETPASGRSPKVDRRKAKSLLDPKRLTQASPALRIALKLDGARSCGEYKALLPEAAANGDQRALRILRKLTHDRGCGILGLQDCYTCLRGSRALAEAIEASKMRRSPRFEELSDPPGEPTR